MCDLQTVRPSNNDNTFHHARENPAGHTLTSPKGETFNTTQPYLRRPEETLNNRRLDRLVQRSR